MSQFTPTMKFYLTYSWIEAKKHKCNTCLGICSVFIVVVIAALCYTLVDNAAVVFFREAEQDYGQYDILLTPQQGPFFNYTLMSNILNDNSINYHTPRLLYNNTMNYLFSSKCFHSINASNIYSNGCDGSFIINATNCSNHANQESDFAFWLIDFEKEEKMKLGRTFNINNKPDENGIIITSSIAENLNLDIDDMVYLLLPLNEISIPILQNYMREILGLNEIDIVNNTDFNDLLYELEYECTNNIIPVKISMISSDKSLGGKFPELHHRWDAVMDISNFMPIFIDNLPPLLLEKINKYRNGIKEEGNIPTLYDFSNMVYINLGKNRVFSYLSTNYQNIQKIVVGFTAKLSYYLGWTEMEIKLDILNSMNGASSTMLSLGVVLDIIIFVLCVLSILLLYSLMVISVVSRTFTMGIFRMVGMPRYSLFLLLEGQQFTYALPAWCIGLIIAQIGAVYVLKLLGSSSNIQLNPLLTSTSICIATTVGIGISMIAAILPIRSAMKKTLQASLDINHSQTKAVKFDLSRNVTKFAWNAFWICCVKVMFGWIIYYFFPQSLLNGNLQLFAVMLMLLMLAILIGCILIGLNLQHLLERLVLFVCLSWWEKRPIPEVVLKNLIAHKTRNRYTALMYAFSLSFVFFVTVMIRTQLNVLEMSNINTNGSKMFCWTSRAGAQFQDELNKLEFIEDYAWKPGPITGYTYTHDFHVNYIWAQNIGRTYFEDTWTYPVVPNIANAVDQSFIVPVKVCGVYNVSA